MKKLIAKRTEKYFAGKKPGEIFRADVDVNGQHVCVVIASGADGWLCVVRYPEPEEPITLAQHPDIEDAKRYMEDWIRVVHNVKGEITWNPGPSSD